jgi:tetratricopeptide (TPR) repeat protein
MSKGPLAAVTVVALAAVLAHAPGLGNGYVWDDADIVLGAYDGGAPRPWTEILLAPDANASDPRSPYYRPLARATVALDRALLGDAPAPRHAESVALHAVAAVLALLLLRRLLGDHRIALVAALLFAIHPVQAEAVNELAARNTLLAAALALAALLAHATWRERGGWWRAALCGGCYFLGLAAKETAAPIILVAAILEDVRPTSSVHSWRSRLSGLASFAVALAVYLPLRWTALGGLAPSHGGGAPLQLRLLQQLWIVPRYLATAAWPVGLDAARRVPPQALSAWWIAPVWIAILAAVAWIVRRGTRAARFGLLFFVAAYLPVGGLIAIPSVPIAERHVYLAALGLWVIAADRLVALGEKRPLRRFALPAGAAIGLLLAGMSARRAADFHDELTFWRSVLAVDPDYSLALVCFGNALHERGDLAGAEAAWTAAVRANPNDGTAWNQLGNLAFRRGDLAGAERAFASAAAFRPDLFEHVYNHALALDALGQREEARAELARARAILPPHRAALAAQIDARLDGTAQ